MRAKVIASVFIGLSFLAFWGFILWNLPGAQDTTVTMPVLSTIAFFIAAYSTGGFLAFVAYKLIKWVCK